MYSFLINVKCLMIFSLKIFCSIYANEIKNYYNIYVHIYIYKYAYNKCTVFCIVLQQLQCVIVYKNMNTHNKIDVFVLSIFLFIKSNFLGLIHNTEYDVHETSLRSKYIP